MSTATLSDELVVQRAEPLNVYALAFSPNSQWLAVGTGDGTIEIYAALDGCRLHGVCRALDAPIRALDWSADSIVIMANSDEFDLGFFDARSCEQLPAPATRNAEWASWSCAVGWASKGIFARFENPRDVQCIGRSTDGSTLAVGDAFGGVSLLSFPAVSFVAGAVSYVAHGGRVSAVAWSASDGALFTVGADDGCVMQWRHSLGDDEGGGGLVAYGASASGVLQYGSGGKQHSGSGMQYGAEQYNGGGMQDGGALEYGGEYGGVAGAVEEQLFDSEVEEEVETDRGQLDSSLGSGLGDSEGSFLVAVGEAPGYAAIHAPSDYIPAEEALEPPDGHLLLEHAYGFSGWARGNLLLTSTGELVYPTACLCVIANVRGRSASQRFFAGHTAPVCALALHPSGALVASAQGGTSPYSCVWNVGTSQTLATMPGMHSSAIVALAFSADGRLLASVGLDAAHTLALYDWEAQTMLAAASCGPELVCGCAFASDGSLATCGAGHLTLWTLVARYAEDDDGRVEAMALIGRSADLSQLRAPSILLCVAFTPRGACATGMASGELLLWENGSLTRSVRAQSGAVHALALLGGSLLCAGRATKVGVWSDELDQLGSYDLRAALDSLQDAWGKPLGASTASLSVRTLVMDAGGRIFVGTRASELFELIVNNGGGGEMLNALFVSKNSIFGRGAPVRSLRGRAAYKYRYMWRRQIENTLLKQ
mmetsp:Transcript_41355/g.97230  ORF Transcript_41355/g.97230 Transcript_41355/m.97230 type:complete len:711 (+) Transcript_41355:211-2343(+)